MSVLSTKLKEAILSAHGMSTETAAELEATMNDLNDRGEALAFTSAAGAGGGATEAMTLTGLLSTDTILAVTQKTPGANSLPLLGYSTLVNGSLTAIYSADPGAGSVIVVSVKR